MKKQNVLVRVLVSAGVLVGAVSLLFALTLQTDAQAYKHVDEVMVSPEQWYGKPLQLHGFAADVRKSVDSLDYRFIVKSGNYSVPVSYSGVVPDTFKDGSEVVLKGRLSSSGFQVEPDGVMAKCPSRYEAGQPGTKATR
jgi:cytochrome c-type biogenesis protein CcmE